VIHVDHPYRVAGSVGIKKASDHPRTAVYFIPATTVGSVIPVAHLPVKVIAEISVFYSFLYKNACLEEVVVMGTVSWTTAVAYLLKFMYRFSGIFCFSLHSTLRCLPVSVVRNCFLAMRRIC